MPVSIASACVFATSAVCAWALQSFLAKRQRNLAEQQGATAIADAEALMSQQKQTHAQHLAQRQQELQESLAAELKIERKDLAEYEGDLALRQERMVHRDREINQASEELDQERASISELANKASELEQARHSAEDRQIEQLENRAKTTRQVLISEQAGQWAEQIEHRQKLTQRKRLAQAEREAPSLSRRLMATTTERYRGISHLERIQNSIHFPNARSFEALADSDGRAQKALLGEIDCILNPDEANQALVVRGDDPLAREIARRVLRQLANRGISAPDKVRATARRTISEITNEVENAGRKAVGKMQIGRVHEDIVRLVGRLKFRLSYSQNQLKHAIEVSYIAGMIADEQGLDVRLARRGGLLHDIGKAMTHDHEGSHAVLGAQVARRCGEDEVVANAIGSHHNDEPPAGAIAHIVTAADCLSGARPGARREAATLYVDRVKKIVEIAERPKGVQRVEVMHAGREVRLYVPGQEHDPTAEGGNKGRRRPMTDAELIPLAEEVAREIEGELVFPGQIRVTVIRESKSVSVAK